MTNDKPQDNGAAVELTTRQSQVVTRVLRGLTNQEIADDLDISIQRVKRVVAAVARKVPGNGPLRRRIREHFAIGENRLAA